MTQTKQTLKEFLVEIEIADGNNYELTPTYLMECFLEGLEGCGFNEEREDIHRWYEEFSAIKAVTIQGEERFFKFPFYNTTGDDCAGDMGLDSFTIDDVYEVYPRQVMTTVYE